MKYLKLFESKSLYFEVTVGMLSDPESLYNKVFWSKKVFFKENDYLEIDRIILDKGNRHSIDGKYGNTPGKHRRYEIRTCGNTIIIILYFPFPCMSGNPERKSEYIIRQHDDDWFTYTIVSHDKRDILYVVDGWDGLEEIIKETFN